MSGGGPVRVNGVGSGFGTGVGIAIDGAIIW